MRDVKLFRIERGDEIEIVLDAEYLSKSNWLGEYNGATGYVLNDIVSYLGSSYIALGATTGNLPTDTLYWDLVAKAGTDGVDGVDGIDGIDGIDGTGIVNSITAGTYTSVDATDPTAPIVDINANGIAKIEGIILTSTDTNTVTTGGRYGMIGTPTNGPIAGEFALDVTNDGAGRIMQIATYTNSSVYTRVFSGTWTTWITTSTLVETLENKTLIDASTTIADNLDNTKKIAFQASGITTATTRIATMPNKDITLAGTTDETFTNTTVTGAGATDTLTLDNSGSGVTLKINNGGSGNFIEVDTNKMVLDNAGNLSATNLTGTNTGNETTTTIGTLINGATAKTIPVDADMFGLMDSADANVLKKLSWANIKATLKTYFDSLTTTLTNKRITKRVVVTTQSATPTINTDNGDVFQITGLAQAITSFTTNLTGTPVAGDMMIIQITDNGTARAITWGASFASTTVTLPATTVISTMLRVGFQRNNANTVWDCIAVA